MMNADDRDAYDFGVQKYGTWDNKGLPTGWEINVAHLADDLPRWLLNEPVVRLADGPMCCVYLRGCYSDRMTRERRAALIRAGGVAALLNATGGAAAGIAGPNVKLTG